VADISTQYTLTTDGYVIDFNAGVLGDGTDKYWLTSITGLDGPSIRAPVDLVPYGDGGIIHTFRKGPRRVVFDGMLLIESSTSQALCQTLRNELVENLLIALDDCLVLAGAGADLSWTPAGGSNLTLADVFYEVGLAVNYSDNYAVANFSFGLVSDSADPF
jgi:hypothetical protein